MTVAEPGGVKVTVAEPPKSDSSRAWRVKVTVAEPGGLKVTVAEPRS